MSNALLNAGLLDAACEPYRNAGRFAYYFARSKLRTDPVYRAILELGLLLGRTRVLDLGCGQGLLAAWLRAAEHCYQPRQLALGWPPAPRTQSTRGNRAHAPRGGTRPPRPGIGVRGVAGRHTQCLLGAADAVVILDVLHYLNPQAQTEVLQRVRAALPARGLLLMRIGDAGAGLRFRYGQWSDKLVMLMRGHFMVTQHCRSVAQWRALLRIAASTAKRSP